MKIKKPLTGCTVAKNPRTDPKNGPVHGLAIKVTNIPLKKEERWFLVNQDVFFPILFLKDC